MPELVISPHNAHNAVDVHLPVGVDVLVHDVVPVGRLQVGLEEGGAGLGREEAGLREGGPVTGSRCHAVRQKMGRRGEPAMKKKVSNMLNIGNGLLSELF